MRMRPCMLAPPNGACCLSVNVAYCPAGKLKTNSNPSILLSCWHTQYQFLFIHSLMCVPFVIRVTTTSLPAGMPAEEINQLPIPGFCCALCCMLAWHTHMYNQFHSFISCCLLYAYQNLNPLPMNSTRALLYLPFIACSLPIHSLACFPAFGCFPASTSASTFAAASAPLAFADASTSGSASALICTSGGSVRAPHAMNRRTLEPPPRRHCTLNAMD